MFGQGYRPRSEPRPIAGEPTAEPTATVDPAEAERDKLDTHLEQNFSEDDPDATLQAAYRNHALTFLHRDGHLEFDGDAEVLLVKTGPCPGAYVTAIVWIDAADLTPTGK